MALIYVSCSAALLFYRFTVLFICISGHLITMEDNPVLRRHFLSLCAGLALAPSLVLAGDKKGQHEPEKQNEPATPGGGTAVGAHPLADGRAVAVNPPVPGAADLPAVMVFFSFYCLPCYVFSQQ
ncbi:TPA: hypothetical protein JGA48_004672, partial [Salmonella enterica]|nr:hypothetical protein [Salmonella enterica]